jgi:hypothetical protein
VKVLSPTRLVAEAADVLEPIHDLVVVVGAAALEVALAEDAFVAITPTRDVDVVIPTEQASRIVAVLEAAELTRSEVPHERAFTWVRGDLKVQLVRSFHPFPKPPASALPENPVFGMAARPAHQVLVAFAEDPLRPRLRCANAACTLALKQAAFGRSRPTDEMPVERDYHDAYLLISAAADAVVTELTSAEHEVRQRSLTAISQLAAGEAATLAAARQIVKLGTAPSQRAAEDAVRRAAVQIQRRLDDGRGTGDEAPKQRRDQPSGENSNVGGEASR